MPDSGDGNIAVERIRINFTLSGRSCQVEVKSHQRFLDMLRDDLRPTGIREGCGIDGCGACVVTLGSKAVTSRLVPTPSVDGRNTITVEGVDCDGEPDPIQGAVLENRVLQCGFYTPGLIMNAEALLDENPDATEEEIRRAIPGDLCRCIGRK